jgi:protein-disulfide isomerase
MFSDLECPFCKAFRDRLEKLRAEKGAQISVLFVHFPLDGHKFARIAAVSAECAAEQGRFDEFVVRAYGAQDSLGIRPWTRLADDAGVADTSKFQKCRQQASEKPLLSAGIELGRELGVHGTPTVVVNGLRFQTPPSDSAILAQAAISQRK